MADSKKQEPAAGRESPQKPARVITSEERAEQARREALRQRTDELIRQTKAVVTGV